MPTTTETTIKKTIHPGTGPYGRVFYRIKFDGRRLSITGVEGPLKSGDCRGGCGQIIDAEITKLASGWTDTMLAEFRRAWKAWHLNDMRAGCEHQRAEGWADRPIDPSKPTSAYGKHFDGQKQSSWNMLAWVRRDEHPEGLLSHPCPTCGYKYGTAWLHEDIPSEVLDFLSSLPDSDRTPPWV